MRTTTALLLGTCLALTACGGSADSGTTPPLVGPDAADAVGAWVLVEADAPVPIEPGYGIDLTAEQRDDGALRISGTAACNTYGGTVFADGDGWEVEGGGWAVTEMACEPDVMVTQQAYLDALTAVTSWARPSDAVLELTGPDTRLRFEPAPPVEEVPLVGTTWAVVSTVEGTGPDGAVSSLPAGAPQPMLQLTPEGLLRLDTGCQGYEGRWSADGDVITLTEFVRGVEDREPCTPNGAALADEVTVSLFAVVAEGDFTARVEDGVLHLRRDAAGLVAYQLVEDE